MSFNLDKPLFPLFIDRPLDLLNALKDKEVEIEFKSQKSNAKGILVAFDIHINLVIKRNGKNVFLRGDDIFSIEGVGK